MSNNQKKRDRDCPCTSIKFGIPHKQCLIRRQVPRIDENVSMINWCSSLIIKKGTPHNAVKPKLLLKKIKVYVKKRREIGK
jgi:hypothetical protein